MINHRADRSLNLHDVTDIDDVDHSAKPQDVRYGVLMSLMKIVWAFRG